MDYKKYYKKESEKADKLIAEMEAKPESDSSTPSSFVTKKEKATEENPTGFNAAKYIAEIRVDARVAEQLRDTDEDEEDDD